MNYGKLIFELANIRPKRTGLPMVIWIKPKTNERHSARIKVQTRHGDKIDVAHWVSVTLNDDPPKVVGGKLSADDYKLIKKFIELNRTGLLQVWNDEIDPSDFVDSITKVI